MPAKDDHIRLETRVLSAIIVPFLVTAFVILYFWPSDTGRLFAWPIGPAMTSFLLGSAYIGGAYFFVRVIFNRHWHHVSVGFLPVVIFAALLLIATVLHWDRFSHGTLAFWAWAGVYAMAPFLVFGAWARNRRTDPGALDPRDVRTPVSIRWALAATGALVLVAGLGLFALPGVLISVWPWRLTPLTARVVGACFALTGAFGIAMVRDQRWTTARIPLQGQALGLVLILIGCARARDNFSPANAFTWIFVLGLSTFLIAILVLYGVLEIRLTRNTA